MRNRARNSSADEIILESKVCRPTLNGRAVAFWVAGILIFSACISLAIVVFLKDAGWANREQKWFSIGFFRIFTVMLLFSVFLARRSFCIFAIKLYQKYADAETRLRCLQTPTCSNYGILAIEKFGVVWGIWKTIRRVKRCCPPGKVDYP